MKKLLVIAIAAFAFTACNNAAKEEGTTNADSANAAAPVETPAETPAATPATTDSAAPAATPEAAPATPAAPAH